MSFFGNLFGAGDAKDAAATANDKLQGAWDFAKKAYGPFAQTGGEAFGRLGDLLGYGGVPAQQAAGAQFQQDPGYQFQLQQGLKAVDQGAAARGSVNSGATLKAEQEYGQGLAKQGYNDWWNRNAGLADTGLNTTNALTNDRYTTSGAQAQNAVNLGNTQVNSSLGTANMITGALGKLFGR